MEETKAKSRRVSAYQHTHTHTHTHNYTQLHTHTRTHTHTDTHRHTQTHTHTHTHTHTQYRARPLVFLLVGDDLAYTGTAKEMPTVLENHHTIIARRCPFLHAHRTLGRGESHQQEEWCKIRGERQ
jgi:hypothetical protein